MKESIWGYAVIALGILAIGVIWFFANVTRTDQHNYNLLKETVEAAMLDSVDLAQYRKDGTVRIEKEKFVENFIRRFAENADLSNSYKIEIYDINETPPKVSLRVSSAQSTSVTGEIQTFNIVNNIDAILEALYSDTNQTCTETKPCHKTQAYISWSFQGYKDLNKNVSTSWVIHLKDLSLPIEVPDGKFLKYKIDDTEGNIPFKYEGPVDSGEELQIRLNNQCLWYSGYNDITFNCESYTPNDYTNEELQTLANITNVTLVEKEKENEDIPTVDADLETYDISISNGASQTDDITVTGDILATANYSCSKIMKKTINGKNVTGCNVVFWYSVNWKYWFVDK